MSLNLANVSIPVQLNDRTLNTGSLKSIKFVPVQPFESKRNYDYNISGQGISIGPHSRYKGDITGDIDNAKKKTGINGVLLKEIRTYGAISHFVTSYFITSRISVKGESVIIAEKKNADAQQGDAK